MKAGLRRLVTRYRGQLQAQASCEQSKEPGKAPLAQVELDGFTYVITRFETPSKKLSPREREVAILVAEGLPNKVIARRLGIRPSSVATHLRRAYRKLNVDSRAALALQSLLSCARTKYQHVLAVAACSCGLLVAHFSGTS